MQNEIEEAPPRIKLGSGLRVVNFSSPHAFTFITGEVLAGCSPIRAQTLMLKSTEEVNPTLIRGIKVDFVTLSFSMTASVRGEIEMLQADKGIDLVLCPRPVCLAAEAAKMDMKKLVGCRVADRVKKTIWADKFCR